MGVASKAITTIGEEVGQKVPGSFFSSAYRQVEKITGKSVLGNKIAKDEIGPSLRALYTSGVTDAKVAARYYSEGVPLEGAYAGNLFKFENKAAEIGIKDSKELRKVFDRYKLGEIGSEESFGLQSNYALSELSPEFKNKLAQEQRLARAGKDAGPKNAYRFDNYNEPLESEVLNEQTNEIVTNTQRDLSIKQQQAQILAQDNSANYALELEGLNSSDPNKISAIKNELATVPEDQRINIRTTSEPKPINVSYSSTNPNEVQLRDQRATTNLMYQTGLIDKKEATLRNKRAYKEMFNKSNKENELRKARIAAGYGDTEALARLDKLEPPPINDDAPWANGIKIALGTAVTGAALCAALSSSRGQQNNAQLYGQQPLY